MWTLLAIGFSTEHKGGYGTMPVDSESISEAKEKMTKEFGVEFDTVIIIKNQTDDYPLIISK